METGDAVGLVPWRFSVGERCIPKIEEIESVGAPLFLGHTSDMVLSFRIGHVLTRFSGACHQQGSCLVWELGAFGSLQHAVLTCFIIFLKSSFPKTQSESALFYGQRAVC